MSIFAHPLDLPVRGSIIGFRYFDAALDIVTVFVARSRLGLPTLSELGAHLVADESGQPSISTWHGKEVNIDTGH